MAKPPIALVEAFRAVADEAAESIACLLIEDGFDAVIMRVLAAWPQLEHRWKPPPQAMPDGGRPTPAAWRWLVEGLHLDVGAIAKCAGVERELAREKVGMLLGNRLALPDGTLTKVALAALRSHARRALGIKDKKPSKRSPDSEEDSN